MKERKAAYTERQADELLKAGRLKVEGPVSSGTHGKHVRASVPVAGAPDEADLRLDMRINPDVPGKYTLQLRGADGQVLRRLDVRGSHDNRGRGGSTESWSRRTHKHRLTDDHSDAVAYTPTDLPATAGEPFEDVDDKEYQAVFEAFCGECGIDPGGEWSDPVVGPSGIQTAMSPT